MARKEYSKETLINKIRTIPVLMLALTLAVSYSCNRNEAKTGYIKDGIYINEAIGWSMPVPEGWTVIEKTWADTIEARIDLEKAGYRSDQLNVVWTLELKKNPEINRFQSNYEPIYRGENSFELSTVIEYASTLTKESFEEIGYSVETIAPVKEEFIDNVRFLTVTDVLIDKNGDAVAYMCQYCGIINNNLLTITISYSEPAYYEEVAVAWSSSKFDIRKNSGE